MTHTPLNPSQALAQVSHQWDSKILPQLKDYIAIPAESPRVARPTGNSKACSTKWCATPPNGWRRKRWRG